MALPEYKSITLLVHAAAGSGTASKVAHQIEQGLHSQFPEAAIKVVQTQSKEHIMHVGSSSNDELIICLSGDGSVHDLAQTLVERPKGQRPTVAVLPAGSGNDYARTLGMPLDPFKALAVLKDCRPAEVDVGRVNSVYFLQTLSFGMDAAIALGTEDIRLSTQTRGLRLYVCSAINAILNEFESHKVKVTIEGREFSLDTLILAVQNGPTYGSGFKVAPHASITDGMLDVYTASGIGKLGGLYYLFRMKNGNHESLKGFSYYRTSSLELEYAEQLPVQCDGERLLGTSFIIDVVPRALDVLVVPSSAACQLEERT